MRRTIAIALLITPLAVLALPTGQANPCGDTTTSPALQINIDPTTSGQNVGAVTTSGPTMTIGTRYDAWAAFHIAGTSNGTGRFTLPSHFTIEANGHVWSTQDGVNAVPLYSTNTTGGVQVWVIRFTATGTSYTPEATGLAWLNGAGIQNNPPCFPSNWGNSGGPADDTGVTATSFVGSARVPTSGSVPSALFGQVVAPSAPTLASAVTTAPLRCTLTWNTPSAGTFPIQGYNVTRTPQGGGPGVTALGLVNTWTDPNPVSTRNTTYTVTAWSAAGTSAASNAVTCRQTPVPLFGDDGAMYGGSKAAISATLKTSDAGTDMLYAILWIVFFAGLGSMVMTQHRMAGGAFGAFAGLFFDIAFGFIPLWAVFFLAVVAAAAFVLWRRSSSGGG